MIFPATWPYPIKSMPPEWVYIYDDGTEFCPSNWSDMTLSLMREDHTMKREFSETLKINGSVATKITDAYTLSDRNAVANIAIYHRNESWVLNLYRVSAINFNSYEEEQGYISINLQENSFRQAIEDNKDTEYTFDLPSDYMIDYSSIGRDVINTLSPIGGLKSFSTPSTNRLSEIAATRSLSNYSRDIAYDVNDIPFGYFTAKNIATTAKTVSVSVHLTGIIVRTTGKLFTEPVFGALIKLVKESSSGAITYIYTWARTGQSSKGAYFIRENFDYAEWTQNVTLNAGDTLRLLLYIPTTGVYDVTFNGSDTTMTITEPDDVLYTSLPIRVVPLSWAFSKILEKVGGGALEYKLSNDYYQPVITSSDGLGGRKNPKIKLKYSDLVKTVKCLDGGIVFFTDLGITVDTIDKAYTRVEAIEIDTISDFKRKASDKHVYSKVKAGYKADNTGIDEGIKEVLCTNVFTITNKIDKELDLTCPYIASPYTIDAKIQTLKTNSDTTTDADNSIFLMAVTPFHDKIAETCVQVDDAAIEGNPLSTSYGSIVMKSGSYVQVFEVTDASKSYYLSSKYSDLTELRIAFYSGSPSHATFLSGFHRIGTITDELLEPPTETTFIVFADDNTGYFSLESVKAQSTLYRGGTSSMKATYFNLPISPMRIIKANAREIGISMVKGTKAITFASSERTANEWSQMPWESVKVYEDNSVQSSEITDLFNNPLFSPMVFDFSTCQRFETIASIEPYKYYKGLDNNTGNMVYFYLDIISLQIGKVQNETVTGLMYDI